MIPTRTGLFSMASMASAVLLLLARLTARVLLENRFGGDEEVGGPLAVKRFGVDELEVEAFPSVGASAAEPPVSEELVQRLDPPVSGVMDSPLVLLFAFFSWK